MIFILCQEVSSYNYYVYHMQRTPEKPCLNDVTEVGTWRKTILTIAIILVVMTLLPVWDELAEELGIGLVTTFWFNTWAGNPILMLNEMKIAIFATFKWIVSYYLIRNSSTFYLYRLCVYNELLVHMHINCLTIFAPLMNAYCSIPVCYVLDLGKLEWITLSITSNDLV